VDAGSLLLALLLTLTPRALARVKELAEDVENVVRNDATRAPGHAAAALLRDCLVRGRAAPPAHGVMHPEGSNIKEVAALFRSRADAAGAALCADHLSWLVLLAAERDKAAQDRVTNHFYGLFQRTGARLEEGAHDVAIEALRPLFEAAAAPAPTEAQARAAVKALQQGVDGVLLRIGAGGDVACLDVLFMDYAGLWANARRAGVESIGRFVAPTTE
jgi:hypothetical protein